MRHMISFLGLILFCAPAFAGVQPRRRQLAGPVETVATFNGPMPTGVTVSHTGRIFVNFPRWDDPVDFSVAEIKDGRTVPFPNTDLNHLDLNHQERSLISVQSVVVDPKDRLWILDTGSIKFQPTRYGGPKLVCVDLQTNKVVKTILFGQNVAFTTSYLNDVRFNLKLGTEGTAFITDSSNTGPNGIIVVDLGTGESWRRLNDHPTTQAVPNFAPIVEGQPLMQRKPGQRPQPIKTGADGIAISPDGSRLYYCPLAGRELYSVSTAFLQDILHSDSDVISTIKDEGDKGGGSDGLETDAHGNVYAGDYEHRAILRREPGGKFTAFVRDSRILWPDTLSVANGYLYFTSNQVERRPDFHDGRDMRVKPYYLLRVRLNTETVAFHRRK